MRSRRSPRKDLAGRMKRRVFRVLAAGAAVVVCGSALDGGDGGGVGAAVEVPCP